MKKISGAFCALLLSLSGAYAADAVVEEQVVVVDASPVWSGLYVGGHGGYAWADREWNGEFAGVPLQPGLYDYNMDGALLGAQIGYNWQVDSFVFGVEADASWSDASDTIFVPGFLSTEIKSDMDWMATIRGRAGYAWDRFLVYGTGGVAFARVNTHADEYFLGSLIGSDSASATHTGWTLGAGVEAMVTEKVSVKLEYLYADFGKKDYNYDLISGPMGDETIGTADLSVNSIKLGVNFHF